MITDGNLGQCLTAPIPNTEFSRLDRSLNTMLSRIDRALTDRAHTSAQVRCFVGDASHELRTPLVTLRGCAHDRERRLTGDEPYRERRQSGWVL